MLTQRSFVQGVVVGSLSKEKGEEDGMVCGFRGLSSSGKMSIFRGSKKGQICDFDQN